MAKVYNLLFLCTGNSARSILAEALLNNLGAGRFHAYSAGSFPTGRVNPHALALLEKKGLPTDGLRSKSWDEFAVEGAPDLDFVITVCDNAAGEVCPLWPGKPVLGHWGLPDPAAATGGDAQVTAAFEAVFRALKTKIDRLVDVPIDSLDSSTLRRYVEEIGHARSGAQ